MLSEYVVPVNLMYKLTTYETQGEFMGVKNAIVIEKLQAEFYLVE